MVLRGEERTCDWIDGQLHEAVTFVVCDNKKTRFSRPTDVYHGFIHNGLHERGLPTNGLDMAMQHRFDTPQSTICLFMEP